MKEMEEQLNYQRIKASMQYLYDNLKRQPQMDEIASHVNLSKFHFARLFKEWAGVPPKQFLQYLTLSELKRDIQQCSSIQQLSENAGLSSPSRVYDLFVNFESVTPLEYKTRGKGISITFGIHDSPFGLCFIANTNRGICALEFMDEDQHIVLNRFQKKWANATIIQNQESTRDIINQIFQKNSPNVKALLFGTPFQIKVWEALINIPFGKLVSYNQVAQHIGSPKACRAVGSAIGKNHLGYLIPCHRVIQSMGGLGGYKWGKERKLSIIGWERAKAEMEKDYTDFC